MSQRTCLNCGGSLAGRHGTAKFCRKSCATMHYQRTETRQCSEANCTEPLRARGLCAGHYKTWRREATGKTHHVMHERTCVTCGTAWQTPRPDARFCTAKCKGVFLSQRNRKHSKLPVDHPVMVLIEAAKLVAAAEAELARERTKADKLLSWRVARECPGCACWFTPLYSPNAITCSRRCGRRVQRWRRKAAERNAVGTFTWSEFMRVARRFDYCCAYCGDRSGQLDPDHVVPLSRGGHNSTTNLLPSCRPCNTDKNANLLHEWAESRERRGLPPRATSWAPEDRRYWHLTQIALGRAAT